jgi:cell division protein FtsZ
MNIVGGPSVTLAEVTDAASIIHDVAHQDANIIFGSVIDESVGDAVRVTVIAAGFDHTPATKGPPAGAPATDAPRSDIFANTTSDDFFDVGGDDDLPSFLR